MNSWMVQSNSGTGAEIQFHRHSEMLPKLPSTSTKPAMEHTYTFMPSMFRCWCRSMVPLRTAPTHLEPKWWRRLVLHFGSRSCTYFLSTLMLNLAYLYLLQKFLAVYSYSFKMLEYNTVAYTSLFVGDCSHDWRPANAIEVPTSPTSHL